MHDTHRNACTAEHGPKHTDKSGGQCECIRTRKSIRSNNFDTSNVLNNEPYLACEPYSGLLQTSLVCEDGKKSCEFLVSKHLTVEIRAIKKTFEGWFAFSPMHLAASTHLSPNIVWQKSCSSIEIPDFLTHLGILCVECQSRFEMSSTCWKWNSLFRSYHLNSFESTRCVCMQIILFRSHFMWPTSVTFIA